MVAESLSLHPYIVFPMCLLISGAEPVLGALFNPSKMARKAIDKNGACRESDEKKFHE